MEQPLDIQVAEAYGKWVTSLGSSIKADMVRAENHQKWQDLLFIHQTFKNEWDNSEHLKDRKDHLQGNLKDYVKYVLVSIPEDYTRCIRSLQLALSHLWNYVLALNGDFGPLEQRLPAAKPTQKAILQQCLHNLDGWFELVHTNGLTALKNSEAPSVVTMDLMSQLQTLRNDTATLKNTVIAEVTKNNKAVEILKANEATLRANSDQVKQQLDHAKAEEREAEGEAGDWGWLFSGLWDDVNTWRTVVKTQTSTLADSLKVLDDAHKDTTHGQLEVGFGEQMAKTLDFLEASYKPLAESFRQFYAQTLLMQQAATKLALSLGTLKNEEDRLELESLQDKYLTTMDIIENCLFDSEVVTVAESMLAELLHAPAPLQMSNPTSVCGARYQQVKKTAQEARRLVVVYPLEQSRLDDMTVLPSLNDILTPAPPLTVPSAYGGLLVEGRVCKVFPPYVRDDAALREKKMIAYGRSMFSDSEAAGWIRDDGSEENFEERCRVLGEGIFFDAGLGGENHDHDDG